MLTGLEPRSILMDGHKSELTAYKGIMISKQNAAKEITSLLSGLLTYSKATIKLVTLLPKISLPTTDSSAISVSAFFLIN